MPTPIEIHAAAKRRVRVLRFIADTVHRRGYPPSMTEIADAHGVAKSTARDDLRFLEAEGKIARESGVARGIRVLDGSPS